jgi:PKD repeat protein
MIMRNRTAASLLLFAICAIPVTAQTITLGLLDEQNRRRNGATSFDFDTMRIEAEAGTAPLPLGNSSVEAFVRAGAGRFDSRVFLPFAERSFKVFDGSGNVRSAGLGLRYEPCEDCGWSIRADYDRQHARSGSFGMTRREVSASIEHGLWDGRATALAGVRRVELDGRAGLTRVENFNDVRTEPYAGITINLGPRTTAAVGIGVYHGRPEVKIGIQIRFLAAPPPKPTPPHPPGGALNLDGVSVHSGMLAFENQATFDRTLDAVSTTKAAEELEQRLSHHSLRHDIDQRQARLAAAGTLNPYSDPDNHCIQDTGLRALLNASGEIQIGTSIYAIVDSRRMFEIPAAKASLIEQVRSGASTSTLVEAGAVLHVSDSNRSLSGCNADFSITALGNSEFSFKNASTGQATVFYSWDFGDGSYSSAQDPVHKFSSAGLYKVSLTITDANGCSATASQWVSAQTCYAHFSVAVVGTTATLSPGPTTSGFSLLWDFGDGTTSTEANPTHDYGTVGDRFVCLTITSAGGCTDKYCDWASIKQSDAGCCDANDSVVNKWTDYAGGSRRFKSVLWQRNLPFYHRWGARTINYAKNSNGNWRRAAADRIKVSGGGTIFSTGADGSKCAIPNATSDYDEETNDDKAEFSIPAGAKFWTKRKTLGSLHSVRYGGAGVTGPALFLSHDCAVKECKENCREEAKTCKDVCTQEADQCKQVCTAARKTCSQSCSGGWLKKAFCKLSCSWQSGSCKQECRKGKRTCKRACNKAKRVCKKECRQI